ncbi:hypothetical protein MBLNU459_g4051t1 [Dothideomycetes sp. NU459]
MFPLALLLFELLAKLVSAASTEYIYWYLCTDYVDALIEFVQAYIQVVDINPTQRRVRIEAANNAGTSEQDAFSGNLDLVVFKNTYNHPNLFSISLDRLDAGRQSDQRQWRLPAFDPKNEQKYLYPLVGLDIYLWTASDAALFLDVLERNLPPGQLDLTRPPPPAEHRDSMSPVVQQLEQAVIYEPEQNRASSTASSAKATLPATAIAAYNPAAPAAPEPIAHREKTPPPPDADNGTGLADAVLNEQGAYSVPYHQQQQQQQQTFPGPPQRNGSMQFALLPATTTSPASQLPYQGYTHTQPTQNAPQTQYANYSHQQTVPYNPQSAGLQSPFPPTPSMPPAYTPHTPIQSPGLPQSTPLQSQGYHTPLQSPGLPPPPPGPPPSGHAQSGHTPPIGGYSNYQYTRQAQQPLSQAEAYDIHKQAYRPTEAEATHGHGGHSKPLSPPVKPGGFEDRVSKLEKGVGRFLKKLDQKI